MGTAPKLTQGWAQVSNATGLDAYVIYTYTTAESSSDATAAGIPSASRFLVPFDNTGTLGTEIGLVNPNAAGLPVLVTLKTSGGTVTQGTLTLPANGQVAFILPRQFPAVAGQSGLAEFYTTSGTMVVLALRSNTNSATGIFSFTTAPAYAESGPNIIPTTGGGGGHTLTQLGSVSLSGINHTSRVVPNGSVAYVCSPQAISVVDVSNPSAPKVLSTFGQGELNGSGVFCAMFGSYLLEIVNTQSLFVYSLANPKQPQLVGGQIAPPFQFSGYAFFVGSTAFLTTDWFQFSGSTISSQHGDFYAYGFNNPAQPSFLSNLQPVSSQPASSNASPRFAGIAVDNQTAYLASTTSTGGDPNGGQAAIQVIDISNPANMAALSQVLIPQATIATAFAIQGNIALVAGNTKSWRNPGTPNFDFTGLLTLTALDITNHRNPVPLSTLVTSFPTNFNVGSVLAPIGSSRFVVSILPGADNNASGDPLGSGQLAIVDATDPHNLKLTPVVAVSQLDLIAVSGGTLYALNANGLNTYRIGQ
jgi:hypothetical protein